MLKKLLYENTFNQIFTQHYTRLSSSKGEEALLCFGPHVFGIPSRTSGQQRVRFVALSHENQVLASIVVIFHTDDSIMVFIIHLPVEVLR